MQPQPRSTMPGTMARIVFTTPRTFASGTCGLKKNSAYMYGAGGIRVNVTASGPIITNIGAPSPRSWAPRVKGGMSMLPTPVAADVLAASIAFCSATTA